jgi:hypothetical protein
MQKRLLRLLIMIAWCAAWAENAADCQSIVSEHFPRRQDLTILCWSIPEQSDGYLSQIDVFQTDIRGMARLLWKAPLVYAYSPKIRFIDEISPQGLALALVERQTGAASSPPDVIGKKAGRIESLLELDGFEFDVEHLDGAKLPFIIVHSDASILDVPAIYRWNGARFVEDRRSHAGYYRDLLAEDRRTLPENASGVVLVNLSRIAMLAGDRSGARTILNDALASERSKGDTADSETLRLINQALHAPTQATR